MCLTPSESGCETVRGESARRERIIWSTRLLEAIVDQYFVLLETLGSGSKGSRRNGSAARGPRGCG